MNPSSRMRSRSLMPLIDSFTTFQLGVLDKLIPRPQTLCSDDLRRARLLVGILFYALILNAVLVAVRYNNFGWTPATINSGLGLVIFIGLLLLYKTTAQLNIISDLAVAFGIFSITITIYNDGGLTSRATNWLLVFPLVSQSIAYRLKAKASVFITISVISIMYWAHHTEFIVSHESLQTLFSRALTLSMVILFIAIVTLIYDNSRLLLEKKLTIEKNNAEKAFKLKSEFLATMSHELRTPFNGVLGMLELLSNSSLTDQQRHRVGLAKSSAETLLLLINDILDFSKIEAGKQDIESIDFNAETLFGNIAEAMAYNASAKGIEVILDTHALQQANFKGDPNRLRQVSTNLISNAIKFTTKGEVIITVRSQKNYDSHTLYVSIKDSGIGIAKNKIDILFDSFTQVDASTSRKYGGSGLGLSIAKNLSELMGGDISVTSTEGKGSTFSFTAELKNASDHQGHTLPSIANKHIIIIDDNKHVLSSLYNQLDNRNAIIKTFSNIKEAINYIDGQTTNIDLIFIDVNMPKENGIQFTKHMRTHKRLDSTKIILMSGIDTLDGDDILTDIGVDASFPKPATSKDIYQALMLITPSEKSGSTKLQAGKVQDSIDLTDYKTNIHILVVDDSPINLEVAAALLDSFDIQPVLASSAKEAFKILCTHPKKDFIHGIIMDCQMPEMDGFEATKAIRDGAVGDNYKAIPIIALTANAMKGDKEKCLAAGMNDYLTKPININNLVDTINTIIKPNPPHPSNPV